MRTLTPTDGVRAVKISQSWSRLSREGGRSLERLTDRALVRQVREELYPFSPYLRERLDARGFEPRRFRGQGDLPALPLSTLEELRATDPNELILRPTPGAMKAAWPFGRKLALVLAGRRGAGLLSQAYAPLLTTREEGLEVTWTASDLELIGELGARVLSLCGLCRGADLVSHLGEEPSCARLLLEHGAERLGARITEDAEAPYHAVLAEEAGHHLAEARTLLVFGSPAAELAEEAARRGTRIATLRVFGAVRQVAVQVEGDAGLRFFPDYVAAETLDSHTLETLPPGEPGELVLTPLVGHGTALLRYRTGLRMRLDRTPRPPLGSLPRICPLSLS